MLDAKCTRVCAVPWGSDRLCEGPTNDAGRTGVTSLKIGPFSGWRWRIAFGRVLEMLKSETNGQNIKCFLDMKIAIYIKQIYVVIYANASRLSTKPATA